MLKSPPLSRYNSILLFFVLLVIVMFYAKQILIITSFAALLAMLMAPVANYLEGHKFNRVGSSLVSILIILLAISMVLSLIVIQVAAFIDDIPNIQKRVEEMFASLQSWIETNFRINPEQQIASIKENSKSVLANVGQYLTGILTGTATFIGSFILVMVFTFLFLYSRERYFTFIIKLSRKERTDHMEQVVTRVSQVAQKYLVGRMISIVLLGIFYAIGLSIIGIKNAILLSLIAALVTFIPYVGPVLGGAFPFFMALVTEDSFSPAIWVIVVIAAVQTFDNYFVEPYVVGGNVNINAFFTIMILIIGGTLWGIAGVILFLPLLGMLKIIFDNVEGLQPYAYLIGGDNGNGHDESVWKKITSKFKNNGKPKENPLSDTPSTKNK